jgi:hypothetical protein
MTQGLDYAWGWPLDPAPFIRAIRAGGFAFVFRYLSHDDGKNLHPDEAKALSAAGISIGVVWETTETRASEGYGAGRQDAKDALLQAEACGMPAGRPIYFAVDYDANPADVDQYFHGVVSVLGAARAGVYGGVRVVAHLLDAGLVDWAWQASAWSKGQWDGRAQVRQYGQRTVAGVDCDVNEAMKTDIGAWRVGVAPSSSGQQEDDMRGNLDKGADEVTSLSWPKGSAKAIGFFCDTGLLKSGPLDLRVAFELPPDAKGNVAYEVQKVTLRSDKQKPVVSFGVHAGDVAAVSVQRLNGTGNESISWDAS